MECSDTDKSVALEKKYGVPHFADLDEFLKARILGVIAVEAVILATPTHMHMSMAGMLVGSGLSVLIEKPLCATAGEGRRFLQASKAESNAVYMVGHHRRHNGYVKAIKYMLDEKKLGRVVAVNGGK